MAHGGFDDIECERPSKIKDVQSQDFLKTLVHDNHASLIRFLKRKIGDTDEANDIAQDLYYQIARRPDVTAIEQPRAYLFQAARNVIYNRDRHRRFINADGHFPIDDANEADVTCAAPSPERIAQGRQELMIVSKAIEGLSPKCRRAFLMVRFEGKTYKQAAAEMRLSVKSIEYYMRQALTHIRDRVEAGRAGERHRQAAE